MSSIRLSPKHGLNPSVTKCFYCGKDKGIALFGKMGKRGEDIEAPRTCVVDYEPCDECAANWAQGVALLEASAEPNAKGQPPIKLTDGTLIYPTGHFIVVKDSAEFCKNYDLETGEWTFIDRELFKCLTESVEQDDENEN